MSVAPLSHYLLERYGRMAFWQPDGMSKLREMFSCRMLILLRSCDMLLSTNDAEVEWCVIREGVFFLNIICFFNYVFLNIIFIRFQKENKEWTINIWVRVAKQCALKIPISLCGHGSKGISGFDPQKQSSEVTSWRNLDNSFDIYLSAMSTERTWCSEQWCLLMVD